jgi:hypothetical protein
MVMTTKRTAVTRLEAAVENFKCRQNKYCHLGASDTEPDCEFQACIARTWQGREPRVPDGAEEWQLYSDMAGAKAAARSLSAATRRVVKAIQSAPMSKRGELREFLAGFMWRVSWED